MEFKQDDSCSVQKSSCFLEIPFFKLSLTKGTLYFIKKALFYINNKIRITYFISIIPIDSIIAEDIYIHMTILVTNFTHVVYSTFEIASPPIITPDVGVIKFTRPLPALNIDITISGANPNV